MSGTVGLNTLIVVFWVVMPCDVEGASEELTTSLCRLGMQFFEVLTSCILRPFHFCMLIFALSSFLCVDDRKYSVFPVSFFLLVASCSLFMIYVVLG
jgi:hypothetical protein